VVADLVHGIGLRRDSRLSPQIANIAMNMAAARLTHPTTSLSEGARWTQDRVFSNDTRLHNGFIKAVCGQRDVASAIVKGRADAMVSVSDFP